MRTIKFRAWDKDNKKMFYHGDMEDSELLSALYGTELVKGKGNIVLMQYTGLKDKNGVEIYEGDLVRIAAMIRKVIFIDGKFQVTAINERNIQLYDLQPTEEIEVIGNIYEDKDL